VSYDGDVLASATVPVEVEARGIVVVPVPADVATPDDAAVELVTATLGDVRGVRFLAEPRDSRLASEPGLTVDATVAEGPDGFVTTVTITPETVVHDLALLVDKLHPDARVDDMLVTLLPGETATFRVTSPVALEVAALTDRAVLKHAGQLVRS